MKLMVTVSQNKDMPMLLDLLVKNIMGVTKLARGGGFLWEGNTTSLIGVDAGQVDVVIDIIKLVCGVCKQVVSPILPMFAPNEPIYSIVSGSSCGQRNNLCFESGSTC